MAKDSVQAKPKKSNRGRVAYKHRIPSGIKGVSPFTPKEKKFLVGVVKEVIPGKKTRQALALEVYDTDDPNTASVIASENLNKPKFKIALANAFEKADITASTMAEVLKDAMGATKTATFNGEVYPSTQPDHSIRVAAVRAAGAVLIEKDDDGDKGAPILNFQVNKTYVNNQKVEIKK